MSDLKPLPCPFCGHTGLDFGDGSTFRWIVASCSCCGASQGETRVQTIGSGTKEEWMQAAMRDAIEAWNRRAQSSTQTPVEVGTTVQAGQMLTDDEIALVVADCSASAHRQDDFSFARAIEQAVLAKRVPQWLPIETAPVGTEMFVVRAFNVQVTDKIHGYTSDAYGVWQPTLGRFERWPHPFDPTHWMPLPPPPGIVAEAAWQAATQRQRERISALEAQVQALSMDAGRLRTSQSRTGYMCLTDFQHELGEASGGISVYADEDDLKKHRNCWKGCGILKVEVVAAIAEGKEEG